MILDGVDLMGTTAMVTGANSGIGFETALALAARRAHVVLACRDRERGDVAVDQIRRDVADASVELLHVDLASQRSVRDAAARFASSHDRLDVLVNNAGIMACPEQLTEDGHELQMATNHLGHFSLTAHLLDHLLTTEHARVVTVTSWMHRAGHLDPDHLGGRRYGRWSAYARSKLANLLFAFELQRRLEDIGARATSVAAHPGWARSNLAATGQVVGGSALRARAGRFASTQLGQSTQRGALPVLHAVITPDLPGGVCLGPNGLAQLRGAPGIVTTSARSRDRRLAGALWEASEDATGSRFPFEVEPARGEGPAVRRSGAGGRSRSSG